MSLGVEVKDPLGFLRELRFVPLLLRLFMTLWSLAAEGILDMRSVKCFQLLALEVLISFLYSLSPSLYIFQR